MRTDVYGFRWRTVEQMIIVKQRRKLQRKKYGSKCCHHQHHFCYHKTNYKHRIVRQMEMRIEQTDQQPNPHSHSLLETKGRVGNNLLEQARSTLAKKLVLNRSFTNTYSPHFEYKLNKWQYYSQSKRKFLCVTKS